MNLLQTRIRSAKHRLWLNRGLRALGWSAGALGIPLAVFLLFQRLYDWPVPLSWLFAGFADGALLAALIWTSITRESDAVAAAQLDQAAGLKERISSGRFCLDVPDPFAQAVVADAVRTCASITPSKHLRFAMPRSLGFSAGSLVLIGLMFLVPPGLLKKADGTTSNAAADVQTARIAVKKQLDAVRQWADESPVLAELKDELQKLDTEPSARPDRPGDIRHEAVKKIEALADAVKAKRDREEYEALPNLERRLRGLRTPEGADGITEKLTKSLRDGDFKSAQEEMQTLQEQLATLKSEQDKEMVQKLGQQLESLAKQLEQLSKDEKLAEKLEQAGVSKEDAQRMLENLKKEDLEQLKKQLAEKGMSSQQIQNLAQRLQQQRQAGGQCQKMAQSMKQAAQAAAAGQSAEAAEGLSQAGAQLGQLEQMQQDAAEMESTLQALQSAQDKLDRPCAQCQGSGTQNGRPCAQCQGGGGRNQGGSGTGKMGQGRGGLVQEEEAPTAFKVERAKVQVGKGASIGQFEVDGEQWPGESTSELTEVVEAAERDASDRIQRDRIPRQYQKSIKNYFSEVRRKLDPSAKKPEPRDGEKPSPPGSEPAKDGSESLPQ
jgi:hypothetical protein